MPARKAAGTKNPPSERELFFLCGGGGRVVVDLQLLPTGGWRYNSPEFKLHADPGPGALVRSISNGQNPRELDAIFVSHDHLDHAGDTNAMIEAMTFGYGMQHKNGEFMPEPRGTLVAARAVLEGAKNAQGHVFEKMVHDYFKRMLARVETPKPGGRVEWKEKGATLTATPADHEDPTALGFVLEHRGLRIGYTGDTQAYEGIARRYDGCTHLVVNCLRPDNDSFPFHLCAQDVIEMVNSMKKKPRVLVLSHRGQKFIRAGPENQARKVEQATGVRTVLANEGVRTDLAESPLSAFG
jgi:phosphoribosyl 1,2-cyclic phosphodiesterase